MRNFELIELKLVVFLILILCYLNSHGTSKVIIKANVLRGERFVTVKTNAKEIENKVSEVFSKKGFDIVNRIDSTEDILFVDFFVYQFPAQYPTVTITIRTQNGVHYIDQKYRTAFVDRELSNLNLALELAEKVPSELKKDLVYRVGFGDLISEDKAINTFLYAVNTKYFSIIKWKDDNSIPFIILNDLRLYLLYACDFTGLKKQLSHGPIVLKLRINNSARFELVDDNSLLNLNDNQKIRVQEFIDSFPLWVTKTEVESIEILYGIKY